MNPAGDINKVAESTDFMMNVLDCKMAERVMVDPVGDIPAATWLFRTSLPSSTDPTCWQLFYGYRVRCCTRSILPSGLSDLAQQFTMHRYFKPTQIYL
jgi:hypothetical protein